MYFQAFTVETILKANGTNQTKFRKLNTHRHTISTFLLSVRLFFYQFPLVKVTFSFVVKFPT